MFNILLFCICSSIFSCRCNLLDNYIKTSLIFDPPSHFRLIAKIDAESETLR